MEQDHFINFEYGKKQVKQTRLIRQIVVGACAVFFLLIYYFFITAPHSFISNTVVSIEENTVLAKVSDSLKKQGVIRSTVVFEFLMILHGGEKKIVPGDYFFESAVPVYVVANRILAAISETVPAKRGTADAEFTTFTVVNISEQSQSVLVAVYDTAGTLVYSVSTPVLEAGTKDASHPGMIHSGGYYAAALSVGNDSLMGDKMFPAKVFGDTFVGTIRFEGSAGGKIAPVVLNFRGKTLSSCKVKAVVQ